MKNGITDNKSAEGMRDPMTALKKKDRFTR